MRMRMLLVCAFMPIFAVHGQPTCYPYQPNCNPNEPVPDLKVAWAICDDIKTPYDDCKGCCDNQTSECNGQTNARDAACERDFSCEKSQMLASACAEDQYGCYGLCAALDPSSQSACYAACDAQYRADTDEINQVQSPCVSMNQADIASCNGNATSCSSKCQQAGDCDPDYESVCDDCGDTTACDGSCPGAGNCQPNGSGQCYSNYDCDSGYECIGEECVWEGGGGGGGGCVGDYNCGYNEYCDYDEPLPECEPMDPIVVDLTGDGFPLTSAQNGVKFDFFGDGRPHQLAWTATGANVGWLALDLNGDGAIQSAKELFSNVSPQPDPKPMARLGFRALAVYDQPASGGNHDGVIDQKDAVFSRLRVWVDRNHNGISEAGELLTMQQAGIQSISVHFNDSRWTDAYGNAFRYRSKIAFTSGKDKNDRYAYDVILTGVK